MTTKINTDPSLTFHFVESDTMIFSTSVLWANNVSQVMHSNWGNAHITAMECALEFCAMEFNSTVQSDALIETSTKLPSTRLKDSWQRIPDSANQPATNKTCHALFDPACWVERYDLSIRIPDNTSAVHKSEYLNVSQSAIDSLTNYLSGFAAQIHSPEVNDTADTGAVLITPDGDVTASDPLAEALWKSGNPSMIFEKLAKSMSNSIRANSDDNLQLTGRQARPVVLIATRPAWLALPAFAVLLGVIFLVATILRAHIEQTDVPLWKNDATVMLMAGMDGYIGSPHDTATKGFYRLILPSRSEVQEVKKQEMRLRSTRRGRHSASSSVTLIGRSPRNDDREMKTLSEVYPAQIKRDFGNGLGLGLGLPSAKGYQPLPNIKAV